MASARAADRLSAAGEPFDEARVLVLGTAAREPMLELAVKASIDPEPGRATRMPYRLSRAAFIVSVVAHVVAGYALSRQVWSGAAVPPSSSAEFFLFEVPRPREAVPVAPPVEQATESADDGASAPAPAPSLTPPVAEPAVVVEPPPAVEPAPAPDVAPVPTPRAYIDFAEERRRAANQVIGSRADENEALTFSTNDLTEPPREPEPEERRSIFDGAGEPIGPKVGTVGQARTKFGHRVSALCNALTGGFSLMGFGSFCAPPPDGEPSGLFPEVRPAYLDLMPECVDTRDTAPALALEAPFSTVKCRLVKQEQIGEVP